METNTPVETQTATPTPPSSSQSKFVQTNTMPASKILVFEGSLSTESRATGSSLSAREKEEQEKAKTRPRLLHYPPEIRNKIYRLVVVEEEALIICSRGVKKEAIVTIRKTVKGKVQTTYAVQTPAPATRPKYGILGVNKQINLEATAVLYRENTFRIGNEIPLYKDACSADALKQFLATAPPAAVKTIRNIQLVVLFEGRAPPGLEDGPKAHWMSPTNVQGFYDSCRMISANFLGLTNLTVVSSTYSRPEYKVYTRYGKKFVKPLKQLNLDASSTAIDGTSHWQIHQHEILVGTGMEILLRGVPTIRIRFCERLELSAAERRRLRDTIFNKYVREDFVIGGDVKESAEDEKAVGISKCADTWSYERIYLTFHARQKQAYFIGGDWRKSR